MDFKINILNELKESLDLDIVIIKLTTFEQIKQKFVYILKDSYIDLNNNLNSHRFIYDEYLYTKCPDFFIKISSFIKVSCLENPFKFGSINNNFISKNTKISLFNLIKCYLICNDIKYKNKVLFKKIPQSWNAYEYFDLLCWVRDNFNIIFEFLLNKFRLNLYGITLDELLIDLKLNVEELDVNLKNNKEISDVTVIFDIIEFKNGFYFFKFNKFFEKSYLLNKNLKIPNKYLIVKYCDNKFDRKNKPNLWLNLVLQAVNNNIQTLEIICAYIANTIIKNRDVFEKKKVLYIWGESSTGKTTIIARPLWKYFGEENVGILSGSKNFALENLVNKELAILDEYKFNKRRRETDLKLFEGQVILEDVKYNVQEKIKDLNLIVLSNYSINPSDSVDLNTIKHTDEALYNRTQLIKFIKNENIKNPLKLSTEVIKQLDLENMYILIYCNKIYHKLYVKNKGKTINKILTQHLFAEKYLE